MSLIPLLLVAVLSATDPLCTDPEAKIDNVRRLRLQGELAAARNLAEKAAACEAFETESRIAFHLELARILDRQGLHRNTRPVTEALAQIAAAAALAGDPDPATAAEIELARADYHYRAEGRTRLFATATLHAKKAIHLFQEAGDQRGEADAVHRLGLIHFQKGELEPARSLFDRSLELDDEAGSRPFFRGEYYRHAGFTLYAGGDLEAAIPFFESSLTYRKQAGAVDASLFAAITYANALVEAGKPKEAQEPLLYALMIAEKLDSPAGKSRAGLTLGKMYESLGDPASAAHAYEMTARIARAIGSEGVERQAAESLQRLVTGG